MSTNTQCGILIGLPYTDAVREFGEDLIDDLVVYGNIDMGSIFYDSDSKYNVVGVFLCRTGSYSVIEVSKLQAQVDDATVKLNTLLSVNRTYNTYLTLDIM